jgi:hypothetical protein
VNFRVHYRQKLEQGIATEADTKRYKDILERDKKYQQDSRDRKKLKKT